MTLKINNQVIKRLQILSSVIVTFLKKMIIICKSSHDGQNPFMNAAFQNTLQRGGSYGLSGKVHWWKTTALPRGQVWHHGIRACVLDWVQGSSEGVFSERTS